MDTIQKVFEYVIGTMGNIVYLIMGLALLAFLWGVFKYFWYANSPDKRTESVKYITYGLISLFVIASVWGFVFLLGATFDINFGGSNGTNIPGGANVGNSGDSGFPQNFDDLDSY